MDSILFHTEGALATITLNRPDVYNAFDREMALAMQSALDACKQNDIRAVLITGAGKAFSAGQDLQELLKPDGPKIDAILKEHYNPIVYRIRALDKPVVAAVNGVAAGAGANIALCCDVVVAAESASFLQAFSKIGLVPDSGGTYFLPRLIGFAKASALMMLGDKVPAADAERMGMIYKVFGDAGFGGQATSLATQLSAMPTRGLALTKRLLENSFDNDLGEQLHDEELFQQEAARTADYGEGVQAFVQKRKPVFKGS